MGHILQGVADVNTLYQALIEHSQDMILLTDQSLTIHFYNPAACLLTGYTASALLNYNFKALLHETDLIGFDTAITEALASTGKHIPVCFRILHQTGDFILMEGTITSVLAEGTMLMAINLHQYAGLALADEIVIGKELSDPIINSLPGIFYLYDEHGRFIYWNKNFETVSGYTAAEMTLMHPLDFFDTDEKEALANAIKKVFETGSADLQACFLTKSKTKIPYYFNGRMARFGNKPYLIGMGIDITILKNAEAQKEAERLEKEALINSTDDLMWSVSTDFKLIAANTAFINIMQTVTGVTISPGTDLLMKGSFPDAYLVLWRQLYQEALSGKSFKKELHNPELIAAKLAWMEIGFTPIYKHGKVACIVCYGRNISENKLYQNQLIATNKKLETAQQIANLGYWELDIATGLLYWSDQVYRIFELDKNQLTANYDTFLAMVHPDDQADFKRYKQGIINGVDAGYFEHRVVLKNGKIKTLTEKGALAYNQAGLPIAIEGTVQDITERKAAAEALLKQELYFRETLDKMLEGVQVFDADWRCIYVNETVAKQGPYTKEETFGRTLMQNFPGIENTELFKIFEACKREGVSRQIESQFTFPDGSTKWFELSIQPNAEGLFVLSVDIDEKKKTQEAIRVSEEKYRYLFNNNPAIIIIWDLETMRILEVNEKAVELYGYSKAEYLSMDVLAYRPADDHEKIKDFAQQMLTGYEDVFRGTWKHFKKNGETLYMDITSHRIDYYNRKAILSLAKDVTGQYKFEEELKKNYEDIQRLNAHLQTIREEERSGIAREIHDELGQQLTGLKMDAAWLIKKMKPADEGWREKLAGMIALIDDTVKTVRRISSDLRPGILDDLGLIAALEWQSSEFEKRTAIPCEFNTALHEIDVDGAIAIGVFRIYQEALTNIMRHAKASRVKTELAQQNNYLIVTIADNGIGFNVHNVKDKKTLGLVGMEERCRMLGGKLTIISDIAKGTIITLSAPLFKI